MWREQAESRSVGTSANDWQRLTGSRQPTGISRHSQQDLHSAMWGSACGVSGTSSRAKALRN